MSVSIRPATVDDIPALYRVAEDMEAKHETHYFERCLSEQGEKKRLIHVAEKNGRLVGYGQLIWVPMYNTFRRLDIPEIQDLNVIPEERGQGIGFMLVTACEEEARLAGKTEMGISVGLNQSYGPAQRLYVKMGYIPDGAGLCCDDVPVRAGEMRLLLLHRPIASLDDMLTIKMIKELKPS